MRDLTPTLGRRPRPSASADLAPERPRRAGHAWLARSALGVYAVALLIVVLSPSNSDQTGWIVWARRMLISAGVPWRYATFMRVEVVANVLMVVPLGLLGVLSWPRSRWQTWTAYAFLGSLTVELVQGFFLPGREASTSDVVANTLGALLGALVARGVLRLWARARHS